MSQTSHVCHRHHMFVTDITCLSQTLTQTIIKTNKQTHVCHRHYMFVTDITCLSQTLTQTIIKTNKQQAGHSGCPYKTVQHKPHTFLHKPVLAKTTVCLYLRICSVCLPACLPACLSVCPLPKKCFSSDLCKNMHLYRRGFFVLFFVCLFITV